jgi:hypothetical protein
MKLKDLKDGSKVKVTMTVILRSDIDDLRRPSGTNTVADENGFTHYIDYNAELDGREIVTYLEGELYRDADGDVFVYSPNGALCTPWLAIYSNATATQPGERYLDYYPKLPLTRLVPESK